MFPNTLIDCVARAIRDADAQFAGDMSIGWGEARNLAGAAVKAYEKAKPSEMPFIDAHSVRQIIENKLGDFYHGDDVYHISRSEVDEIVNELTASTVREIVALSDDDKKEIVNLMVSRAQAVGEISIQRSMGAALSALLSDPRYEIRGAHMTFCRMPSPCPHGGSTNDGFPKIITVPQALPKCGNGIRFGREKRWRRFNRRGNGEAGMTEREKRLERIILKTAKWLRRLELQSLHEAQTHGRFESLAEACKADAKNYAATAKSLEDSLKPYEYSEKTD